MGSGGNKIAWLFPTPYSLFPTPFNKKEEKGAEWNHTISAPLL
ncbi:MAG: hypothetical protein RMY29_014685 [Nostoc sp. CreGUA01]|nr:hypothetical protein [Nostoc sp. CreGUA01]